MPRISIALIALLLLLALVGIFIYQKFLPSEGGAIATIHAIDEPTKKKPDDPGGIVVPHADSLVYEKLSKISSKSRKINIMPEPEAPLIVNKLQEEDQSAISLDSIDRILSNIEQTEGVNFEDDATLTDAINNEIKERSAKELKAEQVANFMAGDGLVIKHAQESRFISHLDNEIRSRSNGYSLQLGVAASEHDAKILWGNITKRHAKLLQNVHLVTRKVKIAQNRMFYLVIAGNYFSLPEAQLVCKKLINHKQHCIILKS
jgi:hypothetical protein